MDYTFPTSCCERPHPEIKTRFHIESGALDSCLPVLNECGIKGSVLLVADGNTWRIAGERLAELLRGSGAKITERVYPELKSALLSEAKAIGEYATEHHIDAILGVGTGTINDHCRYAAFHANIPFGIVATAPSMDGFCATGAPLIDNGVKFSHMCGTPTVVVGDTNIMDEAPMELAAAGLGDLLGKYVALFDWKLSNALVGEYYCPAVAELVVKAVNKAVLAAPDYAKRKPGASLAMMEALCLSGVGMALTDSTRPASGAEHHLSHFWEMRLLMENLPTLYHGAKVGVASILMSELYHKLAEITDLRTKPYPEINHALLERGFKSITPSMIKTNEPNPLDAADPERLRKLWPQIREWIAEIPAPEVIRDAIKLLGGPVEPSELGISRELFEDGMSYACYTRRPITLFRVREMIDC